MKSKFKTYLVGGAVRNKLMGRDASDLDFVMMAPTFQEMEEELVRQGAKIFLSRPEFLTVRCKHPDYGSADFVCPRAEGIYLDQRHPSSTKIASTIEEDLLRRDVAFNAMAQDIETGEIIDPFGGQKDIQNQVINCVGNAVDRLTEDPLRAWRILRFAVIFKFKIGIDTVGAIEDLRSADIKSVSSERVREECKKMFAADTLNAIKVLEFFPHLLNVMIEKGIWLEPTTKTK